MTLKSFYLACGIVGAGSLPFCTGYVGGENLPDGPCIVAANHSSFLDGPFLAFSYARAKLRPLHMIAYDEPFRHWLFGYILRSGRCIPFRRGDRRSQGEMLRTALGWLAAGEAVGIFPEGHINQRPALLRPRPGAALLAMETGLPVIPAAVTGSAQAFPAGKPLPRLGRRVSVIFGSPLPLTDEEKRYPALPHKERKELIRSLGRRIMQTIGRLSGRDCRE